MFSVRSDFVSVTKYFNISTHDFLIVLTSSNSLPRSLFFLSVGVSSTILGKRVHASYGNSILVRENPFSISLWHSAFLNLHHRFRRRSCAIMFSRDWPKVASSMVVILCSIFDVKLSTAGMFPVYYCISSNFSAYYVHIANIHCEHIKTPSVPFEGLFSAVWKSVIES